MNQYHIYEAIGRGKHSTVYKGRKKKTVAYYAIKSVEKSQKARVLQEVRTMHNLNHAHTLKFHAWYETNNHLWLILEYCVGGDLMSLLRQDMRLPESSIHDFGRDLITALQYLHHNSIIYCDLKPSNILLDENGRIKLGGFGLSRRLSEINKTPLQNLSPAKRGTPCYMAPELLMEGATHSTASDMWALGCVLYECATGHPPFVSTSFNQLVADILHNEPAPVAGATREFSSLLSRLLDKNPATRADWPEVRAHGFWQFQLPDLPIPEEPALQAFIAHHNLKPAEAAAAAETAASLRQSIDITRLSRVVKSNLEKESETTEYSNFAEADDRTADVRLQNPDAELDFEERAGADADEEDVPSTPSTTEENTRVGDAAPDGIKVSSQVPAAAGKARMGEREAPASTVADEGPTQSATATRGGGGGGVGPVVGGGTQVCAHLIPIGIGAWVARYMLLLLCSLTWMCMSMLMSVLRLGVRLLEVLVTPLFLSPERWVNLPLGLALGVGVLDQWSVRMRALWLLPYIWQSSASPPSMWTGTLSVAHVALVIALDHYSSRHSSMQRHCIVTNALSMFFLWLCASEHWSDCLWHASALLAAYVWDVHTRGAHTHADASERANVKGGLNTHVPKGATGTVAEVLRAGDHYEVLGVERAADEDTIRKAKRTMLLKTHPDKLAADTVGAKDAVQKVTEAGEVLGDAARRREYDAALEAAENAPAESDIVDGDEEGYEFPCLSGGAMHWAPATRLDAARCRYCSECAAKHPANDGDIWIAKEGYFRKHLKLYSCMNGVVYDMTALLTCPECALGVGVPLSRVANTHAAVGSIYAESRGGIPQRSKRSKRGGKGKGKSRR